MSVYIFLETLGRGEHTYYIYRKNLAIKIDFEQGRAKKGRIAMKESKRREKKEKEKIRGWRNKGKNLG